MSKWWLNVDSNYTTCLIWLRANTGWVEDVESYNKLDIEHHFVVEEVTHFNHIYNYWLVCIDFKKHKLWNTESANMATRGVVYVCEDVTDKSDMILFKDFGMHCCMMKLSWKGKSLIIWLNLLNKITERRNICFYRVIIPHCLLEISENNPIFV